MDESEHIIINKKTAERFNEFSKAHFSNDSEALEGLMTAFDQSQHSLKAKSSLSLEILEKSLGRRPNMLIAILKNLEKTQTRPTLAILTALIEQTDTPAQPQVVEKNTFQDGEDLWKIE